MSMDILRITETAGGALQGFHVELCAANEMSFDLVTDSDEALAAICAVAPAILNVDGDLAEGYDDAGRTQHKRADLVQIAQFLARFGHALKNCELDIPGFPEA